MRQTFVPIPIAAAIYFFVDLVSVYASPDSDVGHAGHVGGFLAGLGYLAYLWNFRRIGGLTARERFKSPLPFFAMLKKRANPIGFVTSASK
jgi:membrane associated rhomboid family serine protease